MFTSFYSKGKSNIRRSHQSGNESPATTKTSRNCWRNLSVNFFDVEHSLSGDSLRKNFKSCKVLINLVVEKSDVDEDTPGWIIENLVPPSAVKSLLTTLSCKPLLEAA
uniref:Uncharacterized protein n=1 Tax=Romanomermis culicivorax TaxID=13658 RepID=A0A915HF14_ROMCU